MSASTDDVPCQGCGDNLARDHLGIKCVQGHDLCPDTCSKAYIENMLSEPESKIPAKCSLCSQELNSIQLEMHMDDSQKEMYLMYKAMIEVDKTEKVVNCPFCKYFEIWLKSNTCNFFYCRKETCKKPSCIVCYKQFKVPQHDDTITEEEEEEMKSGDGMYSHHKCYEYKDIKDDWDTAIERGTKRYCPNCKIGGMKDDECTHMICDGCGTTWCYFCGLSEADCDKADPNGNIYSHNDDWNENEKRCPMYLYQVHEADDRWPSDQDSSSKTFLHQLLTMKNLREFFKKYDDSKFAELCEIFPTCANHGYDMNEIKNGDLTLIQR